MSEWIKVTERLPEPGKRVIFVTRGGFVGEGYYSMAEVKWLRSKEFPASNYSCDVMAWMPMPEYKEDEG